MKKQTTSPLLLLLAFVLSSLTSFSQDDASKLLPEVTISTTATNVNAKVSEAFAKLFKDAENMKWYNMGKNYLVTFIMKDQKNNALFKQNGHIIYHISYGFENNLPEDLKKSIKTNTSYYNYKISRAINVKQDNRDIWVIYLEDNDHLILVRSENNELEEVKNLKKS